mgnify:CR=1 FL=1
MFPWIYEFRWTAGHLVFLGAFFTVFTLITLSVARAGRKAAGDIAAGRLGEIRWHDEFAELPSFAKRCRHDLTGEVRGRVCPHGFECGGCDLHPKLAPLRAPDGGNDGGAITVGGVVLPLDRRYHRSHTWVKEEGDGACILGLDAFASRIIGEPDSVALPAAGVKIQVNAPLYIFEKNGHRYPVLSPLDGTVISSGVDGTEWWLRVRPDEPPEKAAHLLSGDEIRPWITGELERIEMMASAPGAPLSLAR